MVHFPHCSDRLNSISRKDSLSYLNTIFENLLGNLFQGQYLLVSDSGVVKTIHYNGHQLLRGVATAQHKMNRTHLIETIESKFTCDCDQEAQRVIQVSEDFPKTTDCSDDNAIIGFNCGGHKLVIGCEDSRAIGLPGLLYFHSIQIPDWYRNHDLDNSDFNYLVLGDSCFDRLIIQAITSLFNRPLGYLASFLKKKKIIDNNSPAEFIAKNISLKLQRFLEKEIYQLINANKLKIALGSIFLLFSEDNSPGLMPQTSH